MPVPFHFIRSRSSCFNLLRFCTGKALLFLTIVSDATILCIAPVNNKSIHWSTDEFKAAKTSVRWLLLLLNIFAILLASSNRTLHTTRVGRSINCWCNNTIHFTLSKLKGGHTNENSNQTVRQKENWSSGEEGYAGVASGLCGLDVSAETSLCTWEASARKTKISSILKWHGRFPVSTTKSTMPFSLLVTPISLRIFSILLQKCRQYCLLCIQCKKGWHNAQIERSYSDAAI